jgi:hypothetical protein
MSDREAVEALKKIADTEADNEIAHGTADDILLSYLDSNGAWHFGPIGTTSVRPRDSVLCLGRHSHGSAPRSNCSAFAMQSDFERTLVNH